jgi:hypothetical protein
VLNLLSVLMCGGAPRIPPPPPPPPAPPPPPPPPSPPAPIATVASSAKSPTEKATTKAKTRTARRATGKSRFRTLGSSGPTGLNIG